MDLHAHKRPRNGRWKHGAQDLVFQYTNIHFEDLLIEGNHTVTSDEGRRRYVTPSRRAAYVVFGVTEHGRSVALMVDDFKPSFKFSLKSDPNASESKLREIAYVHCNRLDPWLVPECLIREGDVIRDKKSVWGYNADPTTVYEIKFCSFRTFYRVRDMFMRDPTVEVYDSRIDPLVSLMHSRGIRSWITVPAAEQYSYTPAHFNVLADIVAGCRVTGLVPTNKDTVTPMRWCSVDIETNSEDLGFPDAKRANDVVFMIASTFKICGEKDFFYKHCIVCGPCKLPASDPNDMIVIVKDEKTLLKMWADTINRFDPDMLVSYNGDGFDYKYIFDRARRLGVDEYMGNQLTRITGKPAQIKDEEFFSKQKGRQEFHRLVMPGRLNFDLYFYLRSTAKLDSYKLDAVASSTVGAKKNEMDYKDIFRAYQRRDKELTLKVAEYNIKDTMLPIMIMDELMTMTAIFELAATSFIPVHYIYTRGMQIQLFSLICLVGAKEGYIIPADTEMKEARSELELNDDDEDDDEADGDEEAAVPEKKNKKKLKGATVLDACSGYYDSPVSVLDFNSLYPSIMRAFNLCYSTLLKSLPDWARILPQMPINDMRGDLTIRSDVFTLRWTETNSEDPTAAPVQHEYHFVQPNIRRGLLPGILTDLYAKRVKVKDEMGGIKNQMVDIENELARLSEAKQQGSDLAAQMKSNLYRLSVYHKILDQRQNAFKVVMNSGYGFLAANKMHEPCIGACVTAIGRKMIQNTLRWCEALYPGPNEIRCSECSSRQKHQMRLTTPLCVLCNSDLATCGSEHCRPVRCISCRFTGDIDSVLSEPKCCVCGLTGLLIDSTGPSTNAAYVTKGARVIYGDTVKSIV